MKKYILPIIIILASIILSIYFYPILPDSMASHWNASGVVDGYSTKLTNVLMFPLIGVGLLGFFILVPNIRIATVL